MQSVINDPFIYFGLRKWVFSSSFVDFAHFSDFSHNLEADQFLTGGSCRRAGLHQDLLQLR